MKRESKVMNIVKNIPPNLIVNSTTLIEVLNSSNPRSREHLQYLERQKQFLFNTLTNFSPKKADLNSPQSSIIDNSNEIEAYDSYFPGTIDNSVSQTSFSTNDMIDFLTNPKDLLASVSDTNDTMDFKFKHAYSIGNFISQSAEVVFSQHVSNYIKVYLTKKFSETTGKINLIGLIIQTGNVFLIFELIYHHILILKYNFKIKLKSLSLI